MPRGPQGQKRSADAIGAAVRVARIATGEEEETPNLSPNRWPDSRSERRQGPRP